MEEVTMRIEDIKDEYQHENIIRKVKIDVSIFYAHINPVFL